MKLRLFLAAVLAVFGLGLAAAPAFASGYNPLGTVCQNAPANPACAQNKSQNGTTTNPTLNLIKTAANVIAVVAGVGAVIMIIVSGIMFVTAGGATPGQRAGDPNAIKKARMTLLGAIVGLVIIALAWTIVTFSVNHLVKT